MNGINREYEEKLLNPRSGAKMLVVTILGFLLSLAAIIVSGILIEQEMSILFVGIPVGFVGILVFCVFFGGFKIIEPNEARVLLLFGKYHGTLAREGFFWVNPFCSTTGPAKETKPNASSSTLNINITGLTLGAKKLSLKAMTLNNERQKVNDQDGNPIEIGVVVIWRIVNTAKAVFNVDNYVSFVSTQADSAIRHVARLYPYDESAEGEEKSLRASSQEIAEVLKKELSDRVSIAGIEIMEARISHLAYAPEIAAAMLQRQQASAIIAARQKIVEGAVGMVEMALSKLSENNVVTLDDERKAQMVSNLLVVLCGNRDAQPVVNSGSVY